MWTSLSAYAGLFISAFGAATLLPLQSEAVLAGLLLTNKFSIAVLLIIATVGNVLGSIVNWWIGRSIEHYRHRSWFPVSEKNFPRAQQLYDRYGRLTLLGSWIPFIGDPLTVVAGVMREPLVTFVLIVGIAKAARYVFVAIMVIG